MRYTHTVLCVSLGPGSVCCWQRIQEAEGRWRWALEACSCCLCVSMFISSRVSDSVEKNRRQLQSITDRIRLAQARVDKIKGSKKATKVKQHVDVITSAHYTEYYLANSGLISGWWWLFFLLCVCAGFLQCQVSSPGSSSGLLFDFHWSHWSLLTDSPTTQDTEQTETFWWQILAGNTNTLQL